MGKLDGKVAIVTGAARGLGRAYATRDAWLPDYRSPKRRGQPGLPRCTGLWSCTLPIPVPVMPIPLRLSRQSRFGGLVTGGMGLSLLAEFGLKFPPILITRRVTLPSVCRQVFSQNIVILFHRMSG
jgi:hypothetical protein